MKKLKIIILAFILPWIWITSQAQNMDKIEKSKRKKDVAEENFSLDQSPHTYSKSFTNPTVPGTLIVENYEGDIDITGYPGREVLVEARVQTQTKNQTGLGYKTGGRPFTFEEKHNTMVLRAIQVNYGTVPHINFKIKVPEKTTLKVKILKKGNLETRKTSRLVEVDNQNGSVELHDLQGWAIINTINGDIRADFNEVIANKAMSFVCLNGGVYLNLPKNLKADFKMKSTTGTIQNDFGGPTLQLEQILLNENNLNNRNQAANVFRPHEYSQIPINEVQEEDEEISSDILPTRGENNKDKKSKPSQKLSEKKKETAKIPNTANNQSLPPPPPNVQNSSRKVYMAPMSFEAQANGGGPVFFISARNGEIKVIKNKKK